MDRRRLQQQIATTRQSLFDEGILDQHFLVLEDLEKEGNPDFVVDLISIAYFRDSFKWLAIIEEEMQKTSFDFDMVNNRLYQLKGSSASIGAIRVKNAVMEVQKHFQQGNLEGFKTTLQDLKMEHGILKAKLDAYFELLNQLESAH
ncbi:hypothetical protein ACOSQ2_027994 [Xanthoceras sorbifolium]